jgi:hypothetical protein
MSATTVQPGTAVDVTHTAAVAGIASAVDA